MHCILARFQNGNGSKFSQELSEPCSYNFVTIYTVDPSSSKQTQVCNAQSTLSWLLPKTHYMMQLPFLSESLRNSPQYSFIFALKFTISIIMPIQKTVLYLIMLTPTNACHKEMIWAR